jgi:hypothetical protein
VQAVRINTAGHTLSVKIVVQETAGVNALVGDPREHSMACRADAGDAGALTLAIVSPMRRCSRSACSQAAVATLTYDYANSTAVLGPLATYAEPHAYDLCAEHADRLVAPRGWEVIRLAPDPAALGPSSDDLLALADAVREAARPAEPEEPVGEPTPRGHLRVLRNPDI